MELTAIGAAVLGIAGLLLLTGSTIAMFAMLVLCSLLGGSAAMILPALGGSSIPPFQMVLPFMVARILLADRKEVVRLSGAIKANLLLLAYVGYGVAVAYAGPRIFKGRINVPPMHITDSRYLFDTVRLIPTSQNVTTAVYLIGTLLVAICAYVTCTHRKGAATLVRVSVAIGWIHIFFGVSDLLFGNSAYGIVLRFFRNATYAQLDQSYGSFVRIKGIFPEASSYASFAFAWFVFLFECWYLQVRPRATGPVALALGIILIFSTSATAYVAIGAYAALFVARTLFMPQSMHPRRLLILAAAVMAALVLASLAALLIPKFANEFGDMIDHMILKKSNSSSGLQRLFWARKGFEAFTVSNGLGIGPGSFRSSSLFTAILGSTGVIGLTTFAFYLLRTFRPLRASTYLGSADENVAVGVAAAWAMLIGLIPASIVAPSPDPGLTFAIFAGAALALRSRHAIGPSEERATVPRRHAWHVPAAPALPGPFNP